MPENQNVKEGKPLKNPEIKRKSAFREYAERSWCPRAGLVDPHLRRSGLQNPSGSMEPTLEIGDHILVNKFIYGVKIPFTGLSFWAWEQPQRGTSWCLPIPGAGEGFYQAGDRRGGGHGEDGEQKTLHQRGGSLRSPRRIQGGNPQPGMPRTGHFGPVTVPPGKLFVLGTTGPEPGQPLLGFVPVQEVKGKAFIVYFQGRWIFYP